MQYLIGGIMGALVVLVSTQTIDPFALLGLAPLVIAALIYERVESS